MASSTTSVKNLFQNSVLVLWILFILFFSLLFLTVTANYNNMVMVIPACTVALLIFITTLWFFLEPVIIWGFTIIAIVFYSVFPGFSVALSVFIFATTAAINHLYNKRQDFIDKLTDELSTIKKSTSELEKEMASLYRQTDYMHQKIDRAGLFKKTAELLSGQMSMETAIDTILNVIGEIICKNSVIRIYLLEDDMKTLRLTGKKNFSGSDSDDYDIINTWIMENNKSIVINDIKLDTRFKSKTGTAKILSSIVAAPMISGDRISGLIRIDSPMPGAFSSVDQKFISYIAGISTLVISNIQLCELTVKLSVTDGLTGLYTHKYFMDKLLSLCAGAYPFSIIFIDVDNFKKINDTFGHAFGDHVIIKVAQIIKSHSGTESICARYGGEEFAVIMPGINTTRAKEKAQELRAIVESLSINIRRIKLKVTISASVGTYPDCARDPMELLRLTDSALYLAKRNGKNRVEVTI